MRLWLASKPFLEPHPCVPANTLRIGLPMKANIALLTVTSRDGDRGSEITRS